MRCGRFCKGMPAVAWKEGKRVKRGIDAAI